MSSSLRKALGPSRAHLVEELNRRPDLTVEFNSTDERDAHLRILRTYKERLLRKGDRVKVLHMQLVSNDYDDNAEQKIVEDLAKSDSELLGRFDDVSADVEATIGELCIQQENELRVAAGQRQDALLQQGRAAAVANPAPPPLHAVSVKLPKLELAKFGGDILRWKEFWDSFEASIHNHHGLQPIEKLNYLRGQLVGDAKRAIGGLAVSNANYEVAVRMLKERFGRNQSIIDAHYKALSELPASNNQLHRLRTTFDTVEQHLNSLQALGQDIHHDHFVSLIRSKLPPEVMVRLEETLEDDAWNVPTLRERLRRHLAARERGESQNYQTPSSHKARSDVAPPRDNASFSRGNSSATSRATASALLSGPKVNRKPRSCAYCGNNHWSDECTTYATASARKEKIRGQCYRCLKPDHDARQCRSQKPCFHCKQKGHHHSSLCPVKFGTAPETVHVATESAPATVTVSPSGEGSLLSSGETVLLQTAKVAVHSDNSSNEIRLLFDTGSHRSYITANLMKKLGLKPKRKEKLTLFTFGSTPAKEIESHVVDIRLKLIDGTYFSMSANVVPYITGDLNRSTVDINTLSSPLFKSLPLADNFPKSAEPLNIELLVGNNYYYELITGERIQLQEGLYLVGSKLGWILTGRHRSANNATASSSLVSAMFVSSTSSDLNTLLAFEPADDLITDKLDVSKFWDLETIGINDRIEDPSDEEALNTFNTTIQYDGKRYNVRWPWKDNNLNLPSNFTLSLGRLNSIIRRYKDNAEFLQQYQSILDNQLANGIIERVDDMCELSERIHYIPHHAVITPHKTTTKIRIVYDGSAKAKKGNLSLNDCIHRGPIFLEEVPSLLIRFRLHQVGLVADIEKAFLQIGIQPSDRDVTRFLWLRDPKILSTEGNLAVYRFTRVPFGIIASPFLLAATIKYHLAQIGTEAAMNISRNIYVDNIITGVKCEEDAVQLYQSAVDIFQRASMNVREWASNSKAFMDTLPAAHSANCEAVTVLGYQWTPAADTMSLNRIPSYTTRGSTTKRAVLKFIASLYDPIGMVSPALIPAKLFLQKLWVLKVDWDEELSRELFYEWESIVSNIVPIGQFALPRYVGVGTNKDEQISLHGFCDASQRAYATCIYIRVKTGSSTSCSLLFSKARLAPLSGISLPRLELLAVTIGSKALEFVRRSLPFQVNEVYLWTDSQCVLHWLNSKKPLSVFVSNRVASIKKQQNVEYRYVPTADNPADLGSRGTTASALMTNQIWWKGPTWLTIDSSSWPPMDFLQRPDDLISEQVTTEEQTIICAAPEGASAKNGELEDQEPPPFGIDYRRFSSFTSLIRVTAWCLRFINGLKGQKASTDHLTAAEINQAKILWIKYIQRSHYSEVLSAIKGDKKNPLAESLDLWLDPTNGIIRCGGRLINAALPETSIFPALLPKTDHLTTLIIRNYHEKLLHGGVSHTLAEIRKEYWIPAGRSQVFKFIHSCVTCKRADGGPYRLPRMAPFPRSRVTASSPFTYTGLDYCGPLYFKDQKTGTTEKAWICLFTCFSTRAVHLEVVPNLTSEEFLMCFRRFVARRGAPALVLSDNAAQFKLAQTAVDKVWSRALHDKSVMNYVSDKGIRWNYVVERAPWRGGAYERLMRLVKQGLKKSLGKLCLNLIQLQTLITEIESVVNSRPLTYVGSDFASGYPITPAHFLTMNVKTGVPPMDEGDTNDPDYMENLSSHDKLIENWKRGQQHLEHFWRLWRDEYLLSLRERSQRHVKQPHCRSKCTPMVNDVVLVKTDGPRGTWKLARVAELLQDTDGEVRSAKVAFSSGTVSTRSLMHLFPLECEQREVPMAIKGPEESDSEGSEEL